MRRYRDAGILLRRQILRRQSFAPADFAPGMMRRVAQIQQIVLF
jgi:hypothetical protein